MHHISAYPRLSCSFPQNIRNRQLHNPFQLHSMTRPSEGSTKVPLSQAYVPKQIPPTIPPTSGGETSSPQGRADTLLHPFKTPTKQVSFSDSFQQRHKNYCQALASYQTIVKINISSIFLRYFSVSSPMKNRRTNGELSKN